MSRLEELNIGDVLTGPVTGIAPFGVFVKIAEDADGLLFGQTGPQVGETVSVRVHDIDTAKSRASLTLA